MTFRLTALTPVVAAAPGETVLGRIQIDNDGTSHATYTVEVVGLDAGAVNDLDTTPALQVPLDAGQAAVVDVAIRVPVTLGIGQHAAAFEASSSRPGERAVLTPFTVSIASVSRVELVPVPSTIRGRRRAGFHLDVTNNEPQTVDLALSGDAPDVEVQFTPSAVTLQPGQRVVATGRVRGPRHWSGEPTQHNVVITARGRAAATTTTAAYVQRPLFAHRLRMVVAAFTVVALWLAAIGGVAFWLATRDDGSTASAAGIVGVDTDGDGIVDAFFDADGNPVTATDTDGDGIPDAFVDADGNPIPGTDTDGDGIPDTLVDADGNPLVAIDTNGDGIPDALSDGSVRPGDEQEVAGEPAATILRGTVAIDDDPSTVGITLTPLELGAAPEPQATPLAFRGSEPRQPTGKLWPTRHGVTSGLGDQIRRTVAIAAPESIRAGTDGVWLFTDVLQGQSYEVSFAKEGYDTQSFVVTPPSDGEPVDLDVEMVPSRGSLSGTVVGPSGSLGGADITISDGTLTFQTTSDSTSGAWSIEGVSTPGVYTMSAVLRGYATAVRQVELGPGEEVSDITLSMVPGQGTITGRVVDATGRPLGGVTLTASTGDTTLTSTSLTQGDIGFYSLPQIDVPATYTVRAELEGYITQTRRVPLSGSVSGVDFTMTSETVTLTGRVRSSAGGGIASAGLIISTGDLQFRSSTSASPSAGAFSIDRLPPGTYTITVEHYQHESATEFVTLVAGVPPPPLDITLRRASGPPAVGTGSLVVDVVNDDPTVAPPGILGATVTVSRNRTTDPPRVLQTTDSAAVTFGNLPIGTYTIRVTHPDYNASQPITRSVGMSQQRVEIELQKLGQASGIMIDSITGAPLDDYSVVLHRLNADFTPGQSYGPFTANPVDGTWTTPPTALSTGFYRLTVVEGTVPLGYVVRNDQVLDTSPAVGGRPMTFLVPELTNATVERIELEPIEADPYPQITGRVYAPRLNGAAIEFDPLDDNSLAVTATCNGAPVDVTRTSQGGNASLFDSFTISKEEVASAIPPSALPGSCQFTVGATGRVSTPITLSAVDASNGDVRSDRLVATALAETPAPFRGTLFWLDEGRDPAVRVPISGTVRSATEAITSFTPVEATAATPDPRPGWQTTPLEVTTDPATGAWTLNGQVFGTTSYQFSAANFGTGIVPVRIDQNGRAVPSSPPTSAVVTPESGGFAVELRPPDVGEARGRVTIRTSGTPQYPTNMVTGTDPTGADFQTTPDAAGDFVFTDAIPGQWTVTFDTPPNHRLDSPPLGSISQVVQPGATPPTTGFDAMFTELATVDIRLTDPQTGDRIGPDAAIELTGFADETRPLGPPIDVGTPGTPDLVYRLSGVPVGTTDPATTPVGYTLQLTLPKYDVKRAVVNGVLTDLRNYPITAVAGQTISLDVAVERYGTVSGSLIGRTGGADEPLSLDAAAPALAATLTAERVDADGNPLSVPDEPAATVEAGAVAGSFVVTGPAGFYRLTPAHPEYQAVPAVTPADPLNPAGPLGVFEIRNQIDTAIADHELTLRTGSLSINAVTSLASPTNVENAVYDLYPGSSTCTGTPQSSFRDTIDTGGITRPGLVPGTYCLAINKFDPTDPTQRIAFTAVVIIEIPRATADTPSTTSVIAPLPALRPTLVGTLVAENANDTPVQLTSASPVTVTSTFDSPVDVSVNETIVPNENEATNGNRTATAAPTPPPAADLSWTYTFTNVPYGQHTVTAPDVPGYVLADPTQAIEVVSDIGPTFIPAFVYTLASSPVEIDLGGGVYPSLDPDYPNDTTTVTLTAPSGTVYSTFFLDDDAVPGSPNLLVIDDVAPESGNFTLAFDDALHAPVNTTLTLPEQLGARDRRQVTITAPTADRVRLTGTAQLRTGPDAADVTDLQTGAEIRLTGTTNYLLVPPPATPPDPSSPGTWLFGSDYAIDAVAGTYQLSATQPGYAPEIEPSLALSTAGTVVTRNIEIERLATAQVNATTGGLTAPAGLDLQLINVDTTDVYDPTTEPDRFQVPAGRYYARARATGYPDQRSVGNTTLAIGAGAVTPVAFAVTLPRYARVTVTGPANATVVVDGNSKSGATTSTFEFSDNDATAALRIPSTGVLAGTVSATDYRPQTISVPANILHAQTVALQPNVTVTGSIPGGRVGSAISATNGTTTVAGAITDTGSGPQYTFAGLGIGTWTATYDVAGVGHTPTPVQIAVITATAPTGNTAAGATIPLTVRNVNFDVTVTRAGTSTRLPNSSVAILNGAATPVVLASGTTLVDDPATAGTNEAGTLRLTVAENSGPVTWRVTRTDSLTRTGTIAPITSLADRTVAAAMIPAITGTVTDGTDPIAGATVRICPATPATLCSAAAALAGTTSAATTGAYTFTTELAPGSYRVWAVSGADQESITLTVTATAATLGNGGEIEL